MTTLCKQTDHEMAAASIYLLLIIYLLIIYSGSLAKYPAGEEREETGD